MPACPSFPLGGDSNTAQAPGEAVTEETELQRNRIFVSSHRKHTLFYVLTLYDFVVRFNFGAQRRCYISLFL